MSPASPPTSGRTRTAGGLLMWFAALGGALAWSVHLLAAWSIDELACAAGGDEVAGVPLRGVLGLATALPAAVTALALALAWRAWRRSSAAASAAPDRGAGPAEDGRALDRVRLMAMVGVWGNLLFLAIIGFGGVAILVFPPCRS